MLTESYLQQLNQQQREAVESSHGPIMIIAGAGSGKTKVLTARIAHLINHFGVDSFRIMALTFTNKAATEIKNRVELALGNTESRNIYAGTFHSIFARILRQEAEHLGYTPNFSIYDVDDSKSVIKQILDDLSIDAKAYKPNVVYNRISSAKNELITAELYEQDEMRKAYDESTRLPKIWEIYKHYSERCFRNNAMDFDDILLNTYRLFHQFPIILSKYQNRILHILIDEFQDTNPLQYAIIKKLAAVHRNICVVGDDAQSIYSFRGATIQNILQFQREYPETQVFKLEQNYRSTQHILQLANTLIQNNKDQIDKKLWTQKENGEKIGVSSYASDNEEARGIVNKLMEFKLRHQIPNNKIAILYRTNAQSRVFEENFRRHNIPYIIYGGFSFYQRKEIKDLLSYLKVIINDKDDESLKRIINYPLRGIGQTSINKYGILAFENNTGIYDILSNIVHFESRPAQVKAVQEFVDLINFFKIEATRKDAYEIAVLVSKQTGMYRDFLSDKTPEGIARLQNIDELLNSIKDFISHPLTEEEENNGQKRDLAAYLQQVSLVTSGDEDKSNEASSVKLMTVHAAKGLEFECVFIAGMQEGIFPSMYSMSTRDELEEERRLFYVAITRAEKYLNISFSHSYYVRGSIENAKESRFLAELDVSCLQISTGNMRAGKQQGSHVPMSSSFKNVIKQAAIPTPSIHKVSAGFSPSTDFEQYKEGSRIEHEQFGFGNIVAISGDRSNRIATIIFDTVGEKKIMLKYAKTQLVIG